MKLNQAGQALKDQAKKEFLFVWVEFNRIPLTFPIGVTVGVTEMLLLTKRLGGAAEIFKSILTPHFGQLASQLDKFDTHHHDVDPFDGRYFITIQSPEYDFVLRIPYSELSEAYHLKFGL